MRSKRVGRVTILVATGLVTLAAAAGGYLLWHDPNVQALFRRKTDSSGDPLAFLTEREIEIRDFRRRATTDPEAAVTASGATPPHPEDMHELEVEVISDIPDSQLAKLVLQRLFTLQKHSGISVSVKKSVVYLFGTAQSAEDRELIVETVKALPGVYRVDASLLETAAP